MNLQATTMLIPKRVFSTTKKVLVLASILAVAVIVGTPPVQAQGFQNPSIGVSIQIPLFGNSNLDLKQAKLFIGLKPNSSSFLSRTSFESDSPYRQESLPLFGVQIIGDGGLQDVWTSNLNPKQKLFVTVVTTAVSVGTYWFLAADKSGPEKTVTASSMIILAGLGYFATRAGE